MKDTSDRFIPSYEGQTLCRCCRLSYSPIHPLIRGADESIMIFLLNASDKSPPTGADLQKQKDGLADPEQSPPARGRHLLRVRIDYVAGFIPSEEGQTSSHTLTSHRPTIHPFLRRADFCHKPIDASHIDSSLPTKGSPQNLSRHITAFRFIPSCERQTYRHSATLIAMMIHPFLRRADSFGL